MTVPKKRCAAEKSLLAVGVTGFSAILPLVKIVELALGADPSPVLGEPGPDLLGRTCPKRSREDLEVAHANDIVLL